MSCTWHVYGSHCKYENSVIYACLCLLENGKRSSEEEKSSKESIEDAAGEEGQGKAVKERKKKGKLDKTEGKVIYDKVS